MRWRCKRCVGEAVTRRLQKVKRILVAEAGGCCAVCGYDRCMVNLHFHHVDPATKSFALSVATGKALSKLREEAKKCVLVCANCHGEIESRRDPITAGRRDAQATYNRTPALNPWGRGLAVQDAGLSRQGSRVRIPSPLLYSVAGSGRLGLEARVVAAARGGEDQERGDHAGPVAGDQHHDQAGHAAGHR